MRGRASTEAAAGNFCWWTIWRVGGDWDSDWQMVMHHISIKHCVGVQVRQVESFRWMVGGDEVAHKLQSRIFPSIEEQARDWAPSLQGSKEGTKEPLRRTNKSKHVDMGKHEDGQARPSAEPPVQLASTVQRSAGPRNQTNRRRECPFLDAFFPSVNLRMWPIQGRHAGLTGGPYLAVASLPENLVNCRRAPCSSRKKKS